MSLFKWLDHWLYRHDAILRQKERRAGIFQNFDPGHAKILVSVMIGMCEPDDKIRICGRLPKSCFQPALRDTASTDTAILLDGPVTDQVRQDMAWLKDLDAYAQGRIAVRATAGSVSPMVSHFFCSSAGAYREESQHDEKQALADFYDPATVAKLMVRFDDWFGAAKTVSL